MIDKTLKFVWAYVIENGYPTNGNWNYYGGGFESEHRYDYHKRIQEQKELKEKVKNVGIDWNRTKAPESSLQSCFEGTFNESSKAEALLGTLFFKDGTSIMIGVDNAEKRFCDYVDMLVNLSEDQERVKNILGETY